MEKRLAYYYLHTNGDIIHKKFPIDPSDFTKHIWTTDLNDRKDAWILIMEALALGAREEKVRELVIRWNLTSEDLVTAFGHVPLIQKD